MAVRCGARFDIARMQEIQQASDTLHDYSICSTSTTRMLFQYFFSSFSFLGGDEQSKYSIHTYSRTRRQVRFSNAAQPLTSSIYGVLLYCTSTNVPCSSNLSGGMVWHKREDRDPRVLGPGAVTSRTSRTKNKKHKKKTTGRVLGIGLGW